MDILKISTVYLGVCYYTVSQEKRHWCSTL